MGWNVEQQNSERFLEEVLKPSQESRIIFEGEYLNNIRYATYS